MELDFALLADQIVKLETALGRPTVDPRSVVLEAMLSRQFQNADQSGLSLEISSPTEQLDNGWSADTTSKMAEALQENEDIASIMLTDLQVTDPLHYYQSMMGLTNLAQYQQMLDLAEWIWPIAVPRQVIDIRDFSLEDMLKPNE